MLRPLPVRVGGPPQEDHLGIASTCCYLKQPPVITCRTCSAREDPICGAHIVRKIVRPRALAAGAVGEELVRDRAGHRRGVEGVPRAAREALQVLEARVALAHERPRRVEARRVR
eukprot:1771742-Rhodomonas_salina.1